jgi:hypothetical protein
MWYSAALLFKSSHTPNRNFDALWEEQIVLVEASTETDAHVKATDIGQQKTHSYMAVEGDLITWKFDGILKVCEIEGPKLKDGSELFSRFLKNSEVVSLKTPFSE